MEGVYCGVVLCVVVETGGRVEVCKVGKVWGGACVTGACLRACVCKEG